MFSSFLAFDSSITFLFYYTQNSPFFTELSSLFYEKCPPPFGKGHFFYKYLFTATRYVAQSHHS